MSLRQRLGETMIPTSWGANPGEMPGERLDRECGQSDFDRDLTSEAEMVYLSEVRNDGVARRLTLAEFERIFTRPKSERFRLMIGEDGKVVPPPRLGQFRFKMSEEPRRGRRRYRWTIAWYLYLTAGVAVLLRLSSILPLSTQRFACPSSRILSGNSGVEPLPVIPIEPFDPYEQEP